MATLYIIAICLLQVTTANQYTLRAIIGGSVQFSCYVLNTNTRIQWAFKAPDVTSYYYITINHVFTSNYQDNRRYISISYNYTNLTITNLNNGDAGLYKCDDFNLNYPPIRLVIINPQVVDSSLIVNAGNTMDLYCPFSDIDEWAVYKGDNTLVPFYNLTHLSIWNVSNSGIYYCFKNDQSYSINVTVTHGPTTAIEYVTEQFTMPPLCDAFMYHTFVYHVVIAVLAFSTVLLLIILLCVLCRKKTHTQLSTNG